MIRQGWLGTVDSMDTLGKKIKEARDAKGWSQTKLGKAVGVSRNAVSLWESGKNGPALSTLRKVCTALGISMNEFTGGAMELKVETSGLIPVKGEVRAGAWLEIESELEVTKYLPMVADEKYASEKQFALKVVGNSMDKYAAPGTFVIVTEWTHEGTKGLKNEDVVVVRRNRAMTYECTLKRAKSANGTWELWPESTDPRHQTPLVLPDGDRDVEIVIIGRVIARYAREP